MMTFFFSFIIITIIIFFFLNSILFYFFFQDFQHSFAWTGNMELLMNQNIPRQWQVVILALMVFAEYDLFN